MTLLRDGEILGTISEYNSLRHVLYLNSIPKSLVMQIAFKINRYIRKIDIEDADQHHAYLQLVFRNTRELIEKEFM